MSDRAPAASVTGPGLHIAWCAARGAIAALAVLALCASIGLLLWALTPGSAGPPELLRASVLTFGAAHFLPPTIGGHLVTWPPLLLTLVGFGAVASAANRGAYREASVGADLIGATVTGLVYGGITSALVAAFGGESAGRVWAPVLLGLAGALFGVAVRGHALRSAWRRAAPAWVQLGLRLGAAAALVLLAGGALAVGAGLARSFGTAIDLSSIIAPSFGAGLGMVLLNLMFLPNAVVAGAGYATGIGFKLGAGSYGPFGSHGIDLPALPLLAAVPGSHSDISPGAGFLVFPVAAAVVIGAVASSRLGYRRDRMLAAATASLATATILLIAALAAGGGVQGTEWSHSGVPWGPFAATVAGLLAVGSLVWTGVAGLRQTPWAPAPEGEAAAEPDSTEPDGPEPDAPAPDAPEPDSTEPDEPDPQPAD